MSSLIQIKTDVFPNAPIPKCMMKISKFASQNVNLVTNTTSIPIDVRSNVKLMNIGMGMSVSAIPVFKNSIIPAFPFAEKINNESMEFASVKMGTDPSTTTVFLYHVLLVKYGIPLTRSVEPNVKPMKFGIGMLVSVLLAMKIININNVLLSVQLIRSM